MKDRDGSPGTRSRRSPTTRCRWTRSSTRDGAAGPARRRHVTPERIREFIDAGESLAVDLKGEAARPLIR